MSGSASSLKSKWTPEEEQALRDGVAKHGVGKWRLIQKDDILGAILINRTNVDLKDKWRNLTMDSTAKEKRERRPSQDDQVESTRHPKTRPDARSRSCSGTSGLTQAAQESWQGAAPLVEAPAPVPAAASEPEDEEPEHARIDLQQAPSKRKRKTQEPRRAPFDGDGFGHTESPWPPTRHWKQAHQTIQQDAQAPSVAMLPPRPVSWPRSEQHVHAARTGPSRLRPDPSSHRREASGDEAATGKLPGARFLQGGPTPEDMVVAAISSINDPDGCSVDEVSRWIQATYEVGPAIQTVVEDAMTAMAESGRLTAHASTSTTQAFALGGMPRHPSSEVPTYQAQLGHEADNKTHENTDWQRQAAAEAAAAAASAEAEAEEAAASALRFVASGAPHFDPSDREPPSHTPPRINP